MRGDKGLLVTAAVGLLVAAGAVVLIVAVTGDDEPIPSYGPSMRPTLTGVEDIVVDPRAYEREQPKRGDIVVVQAPAGYLGGCEERPRGGPCPTVLTGSFADQRLLKRVVALPGETIAFTRDGHAVVDGEPAAEPFIRACKPAFCALPTAVTVPEDAYFIVGDNRANSLDSRDFGPVPLEAIDGRVTAPL